MFPLLNQFLKLKIIIASLLTFTHSDINWIQRVIYIFLIMKQRVLDKTNCQELKEKNNRNQFPSFTFIQIHILVFPNFERSYDITQAISYHKDDEGISKFFEESVKSFLLNYLLIRILIVVTKFELP